MRSRIVRIAGRATVTLAVLVLGYAFWLRPWHVKWGASDAESARPLPGDDIVPRAKGESTRAITVQASAAAIWPWLVQIGQSRGGFYSYDWIENLLGLDIHSADRIMPEFQELKIGDVVPLRPSGSGPRVTAIEPDKALVLGGKVDPKTGRTVGLENSGDYFASSWVFCLEPAGDGAARLIVRTRQDWPRSVWHTLAFFVILEPAHFIMERKMLYGIKERAESTVR